MCLEITFNLSSKIFDFIFFLFYFDFFHGKQRLNGSKSSATSDRNGSTSTTLKLSKSLLRPMHSSGSSSGNSGGSSTVGKQIATQQLMLSKQQQRQLKPNSENSSSVNNNNNSTNKNNNNQARLGSGNESGGSSTSIGGSIGKSFGLKRHSPSIHASARSFQYESFHVFDWRDYLIVSTIVNHPSFLSRIPILRFISAFFFLFVCRKQVAKQHRQNVLNRHLTRRQMNLKLA